MNYFRERKGLLTMFTHSSVDFGPWLSRLSLGLGPTIMECEVECALLDDVKISKHNLPLKGSIAFLHHQAEYPRSDAQISGVLQPIVLPPVPATKSSSKRKGLIAPPGNSPSLRWGRQEPGSKSWSRDHQETLLAGSLPSSPSTTFPTQAHLPKDGATHRG